MPDRWTSIDDSASNVRGKIDKQIIGAAGRTAGLLTAMTATLPDKLRVIRDQLSGHAKAASYDGPTVTTSTVSDPTGTAGAQAAEGKDRAAADLAQVEVLLVRCYKDANAAADILNRYGLRLPRPSEIAATDAFNRPGCESCARVKGPRGQLAWWNEPDPQPTDLDGLLSKSMRLCPACKQRIKRTGRLPSRQDLGVKRDTHHWPKVHAPKKKAS